MEKGQQLALEYARRDANRAVMEQRERLEGEHGNAMAAARDEWEGETQRRLGESQEATRKQVVSRGGRGGMQGGVGGGRGCEG